jgi:hypothetical protein
LSQKGSQISFGSEFRSPSDLEELLSDHPFWKRLKDILLNGATFPLRPISNELREKDLLFHQERGNHKSATHQNKIIDDIILDYIHRGYALPLPTDILLKIPNASLAPLGCQTVQFRTKSNHSLHNKPQNTAP